MKTDARLCFMFLFTFLRLLVYKRQYVGNTLEGRLADKNVFAETKIILGCFQHKFHYLWLTLLKFN